METINWQRYLGSALKENEVAIWRFSLEHSEIEVEKAALLLSADEMKRANRFKFAKHRRQFIIARASLRHVLALYAGIAPDTLIFQSGTHGKPFIDRSFGIEFNLSHSHEMAIIGVTQQGKIGIDIEYTGGREHSLEIARHYFSQTEVEALFSLPEREQPLAFLRCWTRKEAYIKAIGEGLSHPLRTFAVSVDEVAQLLYDENDESVAEKWSIFSFTPAADYLSAVIVEGTAKLFSFYDGSA